MNTGAHRLLATAVGAALLLAGSAAASTPVKPSLTGTVRCAGGSAMLKVDPRITLAPGAFRERLSGQADGWPDPPAPHSTQER